jgi:hypothetical protein
MEERDGAVGVKGWSTADSLEVCGDGVAGLTKVEPGSSFAVGVGAGSGSGVVMDDK